ncbi:hypothetical protein CMI37_03240 [Candidatus Pacearchaeota archaeon]|nr:hypothetical protein [Candidatus Pacearchaeota archaeon]|tara:strand:+ start:866 stop:1129 length:264 start_codon:yes stop_codon:yes gene_type:complete
MAASESSPVVGAKTFRSRKFYLAVAVLTLLAVITIVWLIRDVRESGLWGQLFIAYAGVLGLYAAGNVAGKVMDNRAQSAPVSGLPRP